MAVALPPTLLRHREKLSLDVDLSHRQEQQQLYRTRLGTGVAAVGAAYWFLRLWLSVLDRLWLLEWVAET